MPHRIDEDLIAIRDIVQVDIGQRGFARDPIDNCLTATRDDFANACRMIADHPRPMVGIVTGFTIPTATPPAAETDGPLGTIALARALIPMGIGVQIAADPNARTAIESGLSQVGLSEIVPFVEVPTREMSIANAEPWRTPLTHLLALERVGPGYTRDRIPEAMRSLFDQEVPPDQAGRARTMRGIDVTEMVRPAERLFESVKIPIIGIGDGGNEIGMGRLSWDTIRRNIPRGGLIACRVPCDALIVAGVSNWGAWALAVGIARIRQTHIAAEWFDSEIEQAILQQMVIAGPLVDGVTAQPTPTVDGLSWADYVRPLQQLEQLTRAWT